MERDELHKILMQETELFADVDDFTNNVINAMEKALIINGVMPRSFGMVRWYSNTDGDVACVSVEKAKEYVKKYNELSGKEDCYVDDEVWLLLNEA